MSRYRLLPTPAQVAVLRSHCAHARYVWNLAVEQNSHWHAGRKSAPGYLQQCLQLTQARAEYPWLAAGSQMVQQQALRDFTQAMAAFFDSHNPAGRPSWRKAGRHEGFRIVGRRGIDRGVAVSAALSTGELMHVPSLAWRERQRRVRLERKLARAQRRSNRRVRVRLGIVRLCAREADRRKDWAEKASTDLARRFDVIKVEDLQITNMTKSAKGTREVAACMPCPGLGGQATGAALGCRPERNRSWRSADGQKRRWTSTTGSRPTTRSPTGPSTRPPTSTRSCGR